MKNNGNSKEQSDYTSRRDMLKRTAAATTTVGVVGTAATGNAAAVGMSEDCVEIACGPDEKKIREETLWDITCRCEPADSENDGGFRFY